MSIRIEKLFGYGSGFGRNSDHFPTPDNLLKQGAGAYFEPPIFEPPIVDSPLDPQVKNLFEKAKHLKHKTVKTQTEVKNLFEQIKNLKHKTVNIQTPEAIPQATDLMVDTAETVNDIAEAIIGEEGLEGLEAMGDTVKTAEKVLEEIKQPATTAHPHVFSSLVSAATAAFKATPSKSFLLTMLSLFLYNYNKENIRINPTINLKVSKKKLIIIKLESENDQRRFSFVAAPGKNLRCIEEYTPKSLGTLFSNFLHMISGTAQVKHSQLPDRTRSTGFFWDYILSPMTGFALPRVYEKRIYSMRIEDLTYNPFLANGPVTTTWSISPSESLRITHLSQQHQAPEFVPAANEVVQFGSQKAGRKVNINIDIKDPSDSAECVEPIRLNIPNNKLKEITIVQKLL